MTQKQIKRPRDPIQLAKLIGDIATGQVDAPPPPSDTVKRGTQGGLVGGRARADSLSPEQRKAIAKKAAQNRWKNKA